MDNLPPPADLLARAYLDILNAEEGVAGKPLLRRGNADDPVERLLDDLATGSELTERTAIRADLAATAILVARAIDAVPGLTRELRAGSPVVSIATNAAELVHSVREVVERCSFGAEAAIVQNAAHAKKHDRPVIVIARDGTGADHKPDKGNDIVADGLHARARIVGIATDPKKHLPHDLMRASEYLLTIDNLDTSAISLVIEAVTGQAPSIAIDPDLARAVEISDLPLSVRSNRAPDLCVQELGRIVANKDFFLRDGPGLAELAGYGEAKFWGLNLAEDLREYRAKRLDWSLIEKGLLLAGPPGVGKTQFARALANTARVPLVATSVADWNASSHLGGTLSAMKNAFAQARRLAPALILIDELDGISDRARVKNSEHSTYWSQIVNLLLELLSGIEARPGVVVIGCSNYPEHIDPAILRAGRLDRTIIIERPGIQDLSEIFRFHLKAELADADLGPAAVAAQGKTGADVEAWVRRAKSRARRANRPIAIDDLLLEINAGRTSFPEVMRRSVSVHEAGHLISGIGLQVFEPKAVSLENDGGLTSLEINNANAQTRKGIENYIVALLSGRAAEEIVLSPAMAGAGAGVGDDSDFARATKAAVELELHFGFGMFGTMHLPESATSLLLHDPKVLAAIKRRLDACMERARQMIVRNRQAVEAIAKRLQETGYLGREAIMTIIALNPLVGSVDDVKASADTSMALEDHND